MGKLRHIAIQVPDLEKAAATRPRSFRCSTITYCRSVAFSASSRLAT